MNTILLHIHEDDEQESRLQAALDLARLCNGHISCLQVTPLETYGAEPYGALFGMAAIIDTMHDQGKALRTAIETRLQRESVSWDWRSVNGSVAEAITEHSRLKDLIVLSQPGSDRGGPGAPLPLVADVAVHARSPVLVVPLGAQRFSAETVLIGWNGSAEAAHALRLTTCILQKARAVHIVEVTEEASGVPAVEAAAYLSRQNIHCELHDWPAKGRRVSVALRHAVDELGADCLVMGAYGHSRLRETILGGVTRELIASSIVPLLLAH
jgi:nucleotide-binding universal stress UspA family protein